MPFKSEAQRRWMYANKPEMAKEWERETSKDIKLPKRVRKESKMKKEALYYLTKQATAETGAMYGGLLGPIGAAAGAGIGAKDKDPGSAAIRAGLGGTGGAVIGALPGALMMAASMGSKAKQRNALTALGYLATVGGSTAGSMIGGRWGASTAKLKKKMEKESSDKRRLTDGLSQKLASKRLILTGRLGPKKKVIIGKKSNKKIWVTGKLGPWAKKSN